jgi:hypothetical protein
MIKTIFMGLVILLAFCPFLSKAQHISQKHLSEAMKQYTDSIKQAPYPYVFPVFGKEVQHKGFDIPRPVGATLNLVTGKQDLTIEDLAVSFDGITYDDVSQIVNFSSVKPSINSVTFRPDFWVFPFLNISGLFGYFKADTKVNMTEPFEMNFTAHNQGSLVGVGVLLAGGIGPVFFSADYDNVWSFTRALAEPARTQVLGLRLGHQHKNHRRPQTAWSVWAGAQYMKLATGTIGSVNLGELSGISPEDKEKAQEEFDNWYNNLPPPLQNEFQNFYEKISGWLSNDEGIDLLYDFNKKLMHPWNMLVGGQYQFNKHWQVQIEGGFLGSRWQVVTSASYRFGFKVRK